ncbi:hypothetical protein, partial [Phascolarctobacterium sp.]|uniref:hypothetical protein n=1 Tax=Phascolarctobacterium sp. TaxID=2049039 RepID=UPI0030DBB214
VKKLFFDLANIPLSRNVRPHIRFWLLFSFQGSACLPYFGDLYIIAFCHKSVNTFFVTFFIFFNDTPGSVGKAYRLSTSHLTLLFLLKISVFSLSTNQKPFLLLPNAVLKVNKTGFACWAKPVLNLELFYS